MLGDAASLGGRPLWRNLGRTIIDVQVDAAVAGGRGQHVGAFPMHGRAFGCSPNRRLGLAIQHPAKFCNALRAVQRTRAKHPVDGLQKRLRAARQLVQCQVRGFVVDGSGGRWGRWTAQQHVVQRCSQRIDVGPRTLPDRSGLAVLLDGCIGGLEDGRERLALVAEDAASCTKVKQDRAAVRLNLDVVWGNVSVIDVLAVQAFDRT